MLHTAPGYGDLYSPALHPRTRGAFCLCCMDFYFVADDEYWDVVDA